MAKHIIIGRGNLGLDLVQALVNSGHDAKCITKSQGFDYRKEVPDGDYLWITAGFGSVEKCAQDPMSALETHTVMPVEIAKRLKPETKIICFSSDYCADEETPWSPGTVTVKPRSLYAISKISMEMGLRALHRKNTFVIRVGSLYGDHFPKRTFPGRLMERYPNPCSLTLPMNRTTPTPTPWVANVLARNLDRFEGDFRVLHCAPNGMVPVFNWGKIILGSSYDIQSSDFDQTRPLCSNLKCSFETPPEWEELWRLHWLQQRYHSPRP